MPWSGNLSGSVAKNADLATECVAHGAGQHAHRSGFDTASKESALLSRPALRPDRCWQAEHTADVLVRTSCRSAGRRILADIARDGDWNATANARGRWTLLLVRRNGALRRLTRSKRNREAIVHANTRDAENPISGTDITLDACSQPVGSGRNVTRLQRACKSAEQSTADGGDDVVERREHLLIRLYTVEVLDRAVNTEADRLPKRFDGRVSKRAFNSLYADAAGVHMFGHLQAPRSQLSCKLASGLPL